MIRWLLNRVRRRPVSGELAQRQNAYCSFCRRSYTDVGPLVEGPDLVFICGECVELCCTIIADAKLRRAGDPMPTPEKPETDLTDRVTALEAEVARLREELATERTGPRPQ